MARRRTSSYTDSSFIRMYAEVDYERRLSVSIDRSCRVSASGAHTTDEVKVDIDHFRIDFHFYNAWFVPRAQYWLTNLDFEVRARHRNRDTSDLVPVGRRNIRLLCCLSIRSVHSVCWCSVSQLVIFLDSSARRHSNDPSASLLQ